MNKEMTPLEALEEIRNDSKHRFLQWYQDFINERLDIIETALKELEMMKQTKIIVADKNISDDDLEKLKNQRMFVGSLEQCEIKPLFDKETQKKLKALEIIKEKMVNVQALFYSSNYDDYNRHYVHYEDLVQEEYDLLKEVLL